MDGGLMTVEQAAAAFDVSALTLRRRAQYGEIEGAVKVRGRRGPEWRVPSSSLSALGYARREQVELGMADLLTTVRRLSETLADVQQDNARLNRELGGAVAEAARLRAELDLERRSRVPHPRAPEVVDLRDAERR